MNEQLVTSEERATEHLARLNRAVGKVNTWVGLMDCAPVKEDSGIFKCRVCGADCAIAPKLPERAVCPEHCEDHQYEYVRGEGHRCISCFAEPPADWFEE
jgi:hypothetical protein